MNNRANGKHRVVFSLFMAIVFMVASLGVFDSRVYAQGISADQEPPFSLPTLQPAVSPDGLTLANGVPPMIVVADPNPAMQGIQVPDDLDIAEADLNAEAVNAKFSLTFAAAGAHDPWGAACVAFPSAAKTAFNAAAAIWAGTIQSSVPIKISVCWSNIGSSSILGYSGGAYSYRDFTGAPKSGVWYESSLANALHGSYINPSNYDDYITYNSQFSWYFGTDGHPTTGKYDLVTVAAHEMGHGLNFSGTASYSNGTGSYGSQGYPNIYDWFLEDGGGTKLTSYTNQSTTLGSLLTSNSLWFDGTYADAANGGGRVKIYSPSSWASGSSYSHLDYSTYAGTINSMMVYAIGSASSQHNPGPVTKGMLEDMGWNLVAPIPIAPSGLTFNSTPTFQWSVIPGATKYNLAVYLGSSLKLSKTILSSACGASSCSYIPTTVLNPGSYTWKVRAYVGGAYRSYSSSMAFSVQTMIPFDSEFTSNASGWTPLKGAWSVSGGSYVTSGTPNYFASAKHSSAYNIFTYETKLRRLGCSTCSYGIFFNATPTLSTTVGIKGIWKEGYAFLIANDGHFSVWSISSGVPSAIVNWTSSADVTPAWNVLRVNYNYTTGNIQLYINGVNQVSGSFNSHPVGQVGVTMFRDGSSGNKLYVDYAWVTLSAPASAAAPGGLVVSDANLAPAAAGSMMTAP